MERLNAQALDALVNEHGVKLAAFPDDLVAAARKEAADVLGDIAARSDITGKVHASYDGVPRTPRALVAGVDRGGAEGEGGVNIHPLIPAKAGIQGHLLRLKELGSRWSLYSGRPKAGPEHGE